MYLCFKVLFIICILWTWNIHYIIFQVCSLLHQRYTDFSPCLVQGLLKIFFPGKSGEDLDIDRSTRAIKKRSTLKLLLELYFVAVVEDATIFINIIKELSGLDHIKDRDATQTNLSLLTSFARQGRFFLGLSQSEEIHEEVFLILYICHSFFIFISLKKSSD